MNRYAFFFLSMSLDQAKQVLGFPPGSDPSPAEIQKAYRLKALEHHPDRGGDTDRMVEVNVAKDILEGTRGPSYDRSSPDPGSEVPETRTQWRKPKDDEVSFNEAKSKVSIPGDIEWKFVTDRQRGTHYSSDEFNRSEIFWVAYGRTDSQHIFLGISHHYYKQYFPGTNVPDRDIWTMKSLEIPVKGDEGTTPAWLYGNVLKVLKLISFDGRFNSKVVDAKGWKLDDKMPGGGTMSIKNWLAETGEVKKDDPRVQNRKHVIEIKISTSYTEKPGYAKSRYGNDYELIEIILNGKPHPLSEEDTKKITHNFKTKKLFFGDYAYGGSKKQITRMQKAKEVMEWLLKVMKSLPDDVREALEATLAQKK